MTATRRTLVILLLIVFIDLLGIGILIPILPLVFYENNLLPEAMSFSMRSFLLGLLIAAYPIAQFFGAPYLGALSDQHGRKKILALSLIGTCIGYIVFALGIIWTNVYLLFFSRILDGFTAGNLSVIRSAIADISDEKTKMKNFGFIGMAFGLGFIMGPFIGGKLSDPQLVSWFNAATPFWFAALMIFIDIFLIFFLFEETLKERRKRPAGVLRGISDIKKAFTHPTLNMLFLTFFLVNFAWSFFTQFFQIYMYDKFQYSSAMIGTMFAHVGIWIVFSQAILVRAVSAKYKPRTILNYSLFFTGIFLLCLLIPPEAKWIYFIQPFLAMAFGFTFPGFTTMISDAADRTSQGEVMGIQQSMLSLGQAIPPIIAGLSLSLGSALPIILAGTIMLITWAIFRMTKEPTKQLQI